MKLARMAVAAGLLAASFGITTAADAQYRGYDDRGHYDHRDRGYHRGYDDHRGNRWRDGGYGRHGWHGRHCYTEWRHHHRVRVCR